MSRITHAREALSAWWLQSWLALDQFLNAFVLGLLAVFVALWTATRQEVVYCDETLSAHCWRAYKRNRIWGLLLMPAIDGAFSLWQRDEEGRRVLNHCERAWMKERERRHLPLEYRDSTSPRLVADANPDAMKGPRHE